MGSPGILNSDQRAGCAASPLPSGAEVAPVGPVARDREAVLRKAVCGRGELPAGGVILWCGAESGSCRVPSLCKPGQPSGAFALRDGRWVCVSLRKLYWPCWLVQRSAGGCPGSPPVAGELIYHLPLQVHATVSDPNCVSSVPCPSLDTYPGLSREACLTPGRAEPACCDHSMETSLVFLSMPLCRSQLGSGSKSPQSS